ncbi:hypothetical protein [Paenibacillus massiliensis]|uniref:hypothetical protein n=1 Tax=Paenibacillus massiliensis TaxID=225917 RepID=UPI0004724FC3|nr:hypothetical protein [Paenibacillus massiliensis]
MSMEDRLSEELRSNIAESKDVLELRELLVAFKDTGLSKDSMYTCLNQLRGSVEEDDIILELLDFVVGYCRPELDLFK